MKNIKEIIHLLNISIKEDSESNITGGNIIKTGYNEDIDKYREVIKQSHNWLGTYQRKLIEETGITKLKIKYTNASGYFIEISKSQIMNLPDSFVHKQTLINANRFITSELKEFESKIIEAESNMAQKEYEVFQSVREKVMSRYEEMKKTSQDIAYLDFTVSLSHVAYKHSYICPRVDEGYKFDVKNGRHPVIEEVEKNFIDNDLKLSKRDFIHIVTGPNMGGKSTFLRQNALLALMTHIGSYIPASEANIGIIDKIFSRVGAQDNLFLGKSTFMVEMQEVSHILNNATEKSFIIIDEVGRGTSTYDGMSLAWAILRDIHDRLHTKTLFATHYHEIIDESKQLKNVSNYSVAVGENEENLIFLRKIIPGGIKKSYGLEVARIAGIKNNIIKEARNMIQRHQISNRQIVKQLSFEEVQEEKNVLSPLEEEISKLELDELTPLEALNKLSYLKKISKKSK